MFLVLLFAHGARRSNIRSQIFFKTVILKNSQYSQENTCVGAAFNKISGLKACIFIQKETPAQAFFCEYCKLLKKAILLKTCLLYQVL